MCGVGSQDGEGWMEEKLSAGDWLRERERVCEYECVVVGLESLGSDRRFVGWFVR